MLLLDLVHAGVRMALTDVCIVQPMSCTVHVAVNTVAVALSALTPASLRTGTQ